jgi:hypothetical protein
MLQKLATLKHSTRYTIALILPVIGGWLLTLFAVFVLRDYGLGVFILIPFYLGLSSTLLYGYRQNLPFWRFMGITSLSMLVYCAGLLFFAIEGIICMVMVAPLALPICWIGSGCGNAILKKHTRSPLPVITGLSLLIPCIMGFEHAYESQPPVYTVTTSVIINQPAEKVWEEVIHFSHIAAPTEFLFKAGIAYPTHAEIKGTGKGAIRYCHFSTGSFVEPVTHWQPPELLEFSVVETPEPLKEISPYDIAPAHLHGYFVSIKGQFKLVRLPDNTTRLEGTTWYYNKIKPGFYWKWWSDYIIHSIHNRVLHHIRQEVGKSS